MSIIDHEKRKHGEGQCCGQHKHQSHKCESIKVRFKKLHENAVLPRYAIYGDAGMDCYAVTDAEYHETYVSYKLGFAVEIPYGYVGLLFPRSSNSKKDLLLSNAVGVIDSNFRGEVEVRFRDVSLNSVWGFIKLVLSYIPGISTHNIFPSFSSKIYSKGDAVCQLIVKPIPTVEAEWAEELTETERGAGGFGSTGA